jgi:hypothetical protein
MRLAEFFSEVNFAQLKGLLFVPNSGDAVRSGQIRAVQDVEVGSIADKDKIVGTGFNSMRRLADEKSGRAARANSDQIYNTPTRPISTARRFWALQGSTRI